MFCSCAGRSERKWRPLSTPNSWRPATRHTHSTHSTHSWRPATAPPASLRLPLAPCMPPPKAIPDAHCKRQEGEEDPAPALTLSGEALALQACRTLTHSMAHACASPKPAELTLSLALILPPPSPPSHCVTTSVSHLPSVTAVSYPCPPIHVSQPLGW